MTDHVFETTSSQLLHSGKIFALRRDEVLMPGGAIATRDVVEHFGAVAVVALDTEGRVPLIYQYRHALGRRLWELPAGLLDVGGEPSHLTAGRELVEEAGLTASTWQVLVDLVSTPGFSDESVRVYLATGLTEVDRPEAHDEEADLQVKRVPLTEAVRMVFAGEIVNVLAVAGILAASSRPDGLRAVDAPWEDRPTVLRARRANA